MATAAEATPAALPLPGGRADATVRVHPLLSGTVRGARGWFEREAGRLPALHALGVRGGNVSVPVPAFLVEHPAAGPLLVDTGLHSSVAAAPASNLGRLGAALFRGVEMEPEQAVAAQLRERGIAPSDVGAVVLTHLHIDHASAIADFPGATFVLSAREWRAATSAGPLDGYHARQFDHAFDYRTVDFDAAGVGSWETFGRAVDLLGDGSVMLVSTPGHTHGHLSVVLRLRARDFVVLGDAAYTRRALEQDVLPYRMADEHLYRRSLRELQLYLRQHPDAVWVPGHDLPAWQALDAVYE
jgi:N-acyl homoserine lactone hydrolase